MASLTASIYQPLYSWVVMVTASSAPMALMRDTVGVEEMSRLLRGSCKGTMSASRSAGISAPSGMVRKRAPSELVIRA